MHRGILGQSAVAVLIALEAELRMNSTLRQTRRSVRNAPPEIWEEMSWREKMQRVVQSVTLG